jgi:hypothetical protein
MFKDLPPATKARQLSTKFVRDQASTPQVTGPGEPGWSRKEPASRMGTGVSRRLPARGSGFPGRKLGIQANIEVPEDHTADDGAAAGGSEQRFAALAFRPVQVFALSLRYTTAANAHKQNALVTLTICNI